MKIAKQYVVEAPASDVWTLVRQIDVIVTFIPGAELTEVIDDDNYKGKIAFKVGPKVVTFSGSAQFERIDAEHRGVLHARGGDLRGVSRASAVLEFSVAEGREASASLVSVGGDVKFVGGLAQFAEEGGVYVGDAILEEFGERLRHHISRPRSPDAVIVTAADQQPIRIRFSVIGKAFVMRCLSGLRRFVNRHRPRQHESASSDRSRSRPTNEEI